MDDNHSTNESFDIIVIGGGHAGCEAAITTAKLGFSTALFTINLDRIAWQPCNCLLYTSPSPRDYAASRMPSSA